MIKISVAREYVIAGRIRDLMKGAGVKKFVFYYRQLMGKKGDSFLEYSATLLKEQVGMQEGDVRDWMDGQTK